MKKLKIWISISIALLLTFSASITALSVIPSENPNYNFTLEEVYAYLTGQYEGTEKHELTDIVAYINGEPVYYAEVLFVQGLAEIDYHKLILKDIDDQEILDDVEQQMNGSLTELVYAIARQRAMILEAERLGYDASDEEIRDFQESEKQKLEEDIEFRNPALQEILNGYEDLYEELDVVEEEYNDTYGYTLAKGFVLGNKLLDDFMESYDNEIEVTGNDFDPVTAIYEYYDELLSGVDIEMVDPQIETPAKDVILRLEDLYTMINGERVKIDLYSNLAPQLVNGTTMVPFRFVGETFGAEVAWIDPDSTYPAGAVTYTTEQISLIMPIGANMAIYNGNPEPLPEPAQLIGGKTFVPVRFVSQILGLHVEYDSATTTIMISTGEITNDILADAVTESILELGRVPYVLRQYTILVNTTRTDVLDQGYLKTGTYYDMATGKTLLKLPMITDFAGGCTVSHNSTTGITTITKDVNTIEVKNGDNFITVNGSVINNVPVRDIGGSTYVGIAGIASHIGLKYDYDGGACMIVSRVGGTTYTANELDAMYYLASVIQ